MFNLCILRYPATSESDYLNQLTTLRERMLDRDRAIAELSDRATSMMSLAQVGGIEVSDGSALKTERDCFGLQAEQLHSSHAALETRLSTERDKAAALNKQLHVLELRCGELEVEVKSKTELVTAIGIEDLPQQKQQLAEWNQRMTAMRLAELKLAHQVRVMAVAVCQVWSLLIVIVT